MPIYEYTCQDCDTTFDLFFHTIERGQEAEEKGTIVCPKCEGHKVSKVISCFNVEKLYPILGSKGSNFAGGVESLQTRKPGYKKVEINKSAKKKYSKSKKTKKKAK